MNMKTLKYLIIVLAMMFISASDASAGSDRLWAAIGMPETGQITRRVDGVLTAQSVSYLLHVYTVVISDPNNGGIHALLKQK